MQKHLLLHNRTFNKILLPFLLVISIISCSASFSQTAKADSNGVPEIQAGVTFNPTPSTIYTLIDRSLLPESAKQFTRIRVATNYTPSNITENQNLQLFTDFSEVYNDSLGYSAGVSKLGKWYIILILFDDNKNALAYQEYIVDNSISTNPNQPTPIPTQIPTQTPTPMPTPTTVPSNNDDPLKYGSDIEPNSNKTGESTFSDIDNKFWAYNAINDLSSRKIISGYPDGKYRPDKIVTRAEFAKIMVLAAGLNAKTVSTSSFADVKTSEWFSPYIDTAKSYLNGYTLPDGTLSYHPNAPATREDIVIAMVKLKGFDNTKLPDLSIIEAMFTDYDSISTFALPFIAIGVESKLVSGYPDQTFRPQQPLTRAQAAAILWRAFQYGDDNKTQQQGSKTSIPS
jgi:hypothetical protein